MSPRKFTLHGGKRGAALAVRVTPRSGQNRVAGVQEDGTVKVQLTAAPVDGEANRRLIELLAQVLDVPRSQIEIVAGATGRDKLITVVGIDSLTLQKRLLSSID